MFADAHGITYGTLRRWLRNGLSYDQIREKALAQVIEFRGKNYPGFLALCKQHDIHHSTVIQRRRRGLTLAAALGVEKTPDGRRAKGEYVVDDEVFTSVAQLASRFDVLCRPGFLASPPRARELPRAGRVRRRLAALAWKPSDDPDRPRRFQPVFSRRRRRAHRSTGRSERIGPNSCNGIRTGSPGRWSHPSRQ